MTTTRASLAGVRKVHYPRAGLKNFPSRFGAPLVAGFICLSLILAGGCNSSGPDLSSAPVAEQIRAATSGASIADTWYSSPSETTPLTSYVIDGEVKSRSVSDLFVVGTVTDVSGGKGYSWPQGPQTADGPPAEVVHDFNDDDAWMSTIHLQVSVESALYKDDAFSGLKEIAVGLALLNPVDLKALGSELIGQRIAAPLQSNEKTFFRLEPGVYGVLLSGEMLGFVGDDDKVTFPALAKFPASPDGSDTISLSDLLDPPTTVSLTKVDGQFVSSG